MKGKVGQVNTAYQGAVKRLLEKFGDRTKLNSAFEAWFELT
jgi:uncharacterized protein YecT (DUF1311 family)